MFSNMFLHSCWCIYFILVCDFDQLEKEYKFYWKFDLKRCLGKLEKQNGK
jgi:hypothetical protein